MFRIRIGCGGAGRGLALAVVLATTLVAPPQATAQVGTPPAAGAAGATPSGISAPRQGEARRAVEIGRAVKGTRAVATPIRGPYSVSPERRQNPRSKGLPDRSGGAAVCRDAGFYNMCGNITSGVSGGWLTASQVGFMWTAAQGSVSGVGNFPHPYVHEVIIDRVKLETDLLFALVDEWFVWSDSGSWAWATAALNRRGHKAVTMMWASPGPSGSYPSITVGVRDDLFPTEGTGPHYDVRTVRQGGGGPGSNSWGHYLGIGAASGNGATWVAGSFTMQGPCPSVSYPYQYCSNVEPRFVWFGRQRDASPTP